MYYGGCGNGEYTLGMVSNLFALFALLQLFYAVARGCFRERLKCV